METVRKTYAWQESMQLAAELLRICDEFSDSERNVLAAHLRQAVVDIPAGIASDVVLNQGPTMEPIVRLATELELVHKVYPAIETGKAPQQVAALMERMRSVNYRETEPAPVTEEEEPTESEAPDSAAEATQAADGSLLNQLAEAEDAQAEAAPNKPVSITPKLED